ncbi:hypothetical protein KTU01_32340 [Kocuria turfanensis]|uniref:Uncharacterized protein n=1 Tax=Kocuria turfanensis TaxID=388357 RepID=A0A512IHC7_9MICC|nr:hypothetical protein KTU01_32340 [Kocuria turfanensis]
MGHRGRIGHAGHLSTDAGIDAVEAQRKKISVDQVKATRPKQAGKKRATTWLAPIAVRCTGTVTTAAGGPVPRWLPPADSSQCKPSMSWARVGQRFW